MPCRGLLLWSWFLSVVLLADGFQRGPGSTSYWKGIWPRNDRQSSASVVSQVKISLWKGGKNQNGRSRCYESVSHAASSNPSDVMIPSGDNPPLLEPYSKPFMSRWMRRLQLRKAMRSFGNKDVSKIVASLALSNDSSTVFTQYENSSMAISRDTRSLGELIGRIRSKYSVGAMSESRSPLSDYYQYKDSIQFLLTGGTNESAKSLFGNVSKEYMSIFEDDCEYYCYSIQLMKKIVTVSEAIDFMDKIGVGFILSSLRQLYRHDPSNNMNISSSIEFVRFEIMSGILCLLNQFALAADVPSNVTEAFSKLAENPDFVLSLIQILDRNEKSSKLANAFKFIYRWILRRIPEEPKNDTDIERIALSIVYLLTRQNKNLAEKISHHKILFDKLQRIAISKLESVYADSPIVHGVFNKESVLLKNKDMNNTFNSRKELARMSLWGMSRRSSTSDFRDVNRRGVRILSLDGGGVRGLVSLGILKEIMSRVNNGCVSRKSRWFAATIDKSMLNATPKKLIDSFDIICGTSTGGIIAALLGLCQFDVDEVEEIYKKFMKDVFSVGSNYRLIASKSYYNEKRYEELLQSYFGDRLLLDGNRKGSPRVFFVSTKCDVNPPVPHLWRNYDLSSDQEGVSMRYTGESRVKIKDAVRATTAAPTYFSPISIDGRLYCDGALVANNPTALAIKEAEMLFPSIPIELVLSIGTGAYPISNQLSADSLTFNWKSLINTVVSSSTDTEDVHHHLSDSIKGSKYFRFNPLLKNKIRIDEGGPHAIESLKNDVDNYFAYLSGGSKDSDEASNSSLRKVIKLLSS